MANILNSDGVNGSYAVNGSYGVNGSYAVNRSYGVNGSYAVNWSDGVNRSYGILNCSGIDKAIFLADKPRSFSIFGKSVLEARFHEVWENLFKKLNGWYPRFNNVVFTDEAWKDIPIEVLEYIKSLSEFDPVMFKRITGIDASTQKLPAKKIKIRLAEEQIVEGELID